MSEFKKNLLLCCVCQALLISGQISVKDTVFIERHPTWGTAQSIYHDPNPASRYYKRLASFTFGAFDKESYNESIHYLKQKNLSLVKRKPVIALTKWVRIYAYKEVLYAYHPCDFFTFFQVSINDSTYIDWTGEGPVASKILAQKKEDARNYEFILTGIYNREKTIRIHILDDEKGIAVFEEKSGETEDSYYYFMVAAEKIRALPLIVNNCEDTKQRELQFDEPDYKKWLQKK